MSQPFLVKYDSVVVRNILGIPMDNPWAGGMNSVQFSQIDLNFDGIKDLHVFDRTGNRQTTYLNVGTPGNSKYKHAPEYQKNFPRGTAFVLLRDMDCDGLEDFITYFPGGLSLYLNKSTPGNIQFQLKTKTIMGYHPTLSLKWHPIFTTDVDYPAIDDIDNDGDLDILVWEQFGTTVWYYKNQSLETYGTCDSLFFETKNVCWGWFFENGLSNAVTLNNYNCFSQVPNPEQIEMKDKPNTKKGKHQGGTLLTLDLDNDTVMELVIGDISYPNFIALENGGARDSAHFDSQDTLFPSNNSSTIATNLSLCPAGFYIDVDNDSVKDLIASPFALAQFPTGQFIENEKSVWWYKNVGTNHLPDFQFQSTEWLQNGMMEHGEGSYPQFFDYNNDSLLDLVVGNYGYYNNTLFYNSQLALYENIGTKFKPEYRLITDDYAGLKSIVLDTAIGQPAQDIHPTFGDMDGDGDKDMFIGESNGTIHYFENTAPIGQNAVFTLDSSNFQQIDVGQAAAPCIVDLDRDGLLDLVIGERKGKLKYYQNTGTASYPSFTKVSDSLGRVNTEYNSVGFTNPQFIDSAGTYILYCGSFAGGIHRYTNIDGNLSGTFTLEDDTLKDIWEGTRTAVAIADINNDGLRDMVIGNYSGGLSLYKGDVSSGIETLEIETLNSVVYPNPTNQNLNVVVHNNGVLVEAVLCDVSGRLVSTHTFRGKFNLPMTQLDAGVYLLRLSEGSAISTHRIVKN